MFQEIIIAGFGGQGVMSMGQLIAYAGMMEGKFVSWLPSYGPEQRGGTANVSVVLSDEPVGSPVVIHPSTAIVLNNPSFNKFDQKICPGGLLIVNSSLVTRKSERKDITVSEINAPEGAGELGNAKIATIFLLGAFIEISNALSVSSVIKSLKKVLPPEKHHLISLNELALKKGAQLAMEKASN